MANRKDIEFIEELVRRKTSGEITATEMQDQIDAMLFDTMLEYIPTQENLPIPPEGAFPRKVAHAETFPLGRWSGGPVRQLGEEPKHQTYEKEQWGVTGVTEHDWEEYDAYMRELHGPDWEDSNYEELGDLEYEAKNQDGEYEKDVAAYLKVREKYGDPFSWGGDYLSDKEIQDMRDEGQALRDQMEGFRKKEREGVDILFDDIEAEDKLGGLLSFLAEKGAKGSRLLGGAGMALYPSSTALDEDEDIALMRQMQNELRRRRR